ncbi:hypothetical protein [Terasakiella pusilla]|uniref:hypothetical protein n=1 Tax=Terasakiella pusilla TaxID=64973 RepID=UPI003AA93945
MKSRFKTGLIAVVLLLGLSAFSCAPANDEDYADLAVHLGWVAGAVQGFVEFVEPEAGLSGGEILKQALVMNPDLMKGLQGYYVTSRIKGAYSSVLLCDADQMVLLAEDAGCSATRLDGRFWDQAPLPCEFQLNLIEVCAASK